MSRQIRRRIRWGRVCAAVIGGALAVTLLTGFYDGDQKLVQTVYTVKDGDTLRDISEMFLPLNTGGRRYILEFEEGIVELNPELHGNRGNIYPGQEIRINYWVKE
ncbi:MAG: LysM domain-containing protein [Anaerovibrio sp.]|uniref:LysM peptidoglycan-binding domain-containing protein n=1 Tax=Anaerovibrio sp. TaxID=1872532 RepID=UPI00262D0630|nr:LysM domain-containing protein [Anaerovibrio sp.]MDD7676918.1 LysM domain-containing protein [Anaerovibrio sp.]MDY2603182.1 LysM domain-containing protein [Anaerovibrio sp.]